MGMTIKIRWNTEPGDMLTLRCQATTTYRGAVRGETVTAIQCDREKGHWGAHQHAFLSGTRYVWTEAEAEFAFRGHIAPEDIEDLGRRGWTNQCAGCGEKLPKWADTSYRHQCAGAAGRVIRSNAMALIRGLDWESADKSRVGGPREHFQRLADAVGLGHIILRDADAPAGDAENYRSVQRCFFAAQDLNDTDGRVYQCQYAKGHAGDHIHHSEKDGYGYTRVWK
jgi:hypothetical protein